MSPESQPEPSNREATSIATLELPAAADGAPVIRAEDHDVGPPVPDEAKTVAADRPSAADSPIPDPVPGDHPSHAPIPDPFDDAEALEELEEQITTLAAHIHAATHRLLTLIADFDRRRGWELGGHRSCAQWLSYRTGIDLGAAREKVRAARALVGLPETSASMARGELSFSKVRALTRVATEANEGKLLDFAKESTTAQVERMVRGFKCGSREDELALERERYGSRTLSVFPDVDGMYVVKGRLPAEMGVLLMRAIEAASDALYREKEKACSEATGMNKQKATDGSRQTDAGQDRGMVRDPSTDRDPHPDRDTESRRAAAQRRADALGLLAERALAAGFGGRVRGGDEEAPKGAGDGGKTEGDADREAEGGEEVQARTQAPISGSRAERYQVVLHVETETLRADGEVGRSELEDGTRVSAETSRRISCDSGLVRIRHAPDGSFLHVGRKTRTIPPAVRRALEARDQGCCFPGCGSRFAEGHHVKHWADGGETKLDNLVLLCRYHHRLVHEDRWKVEWGAESRPVFFDPRGRACSEGRNQGDHR
jgi:hypothetical protein